MQIPSRYRGHWHGEVSDVTLVGKYHSEIIITENEISAEYTMKQGKQKAQIALLCVSDGFIALKEDTGSFHGTLLLYLDVNKKLKCVWHKKTSFNSEAIMTRVPSYSAGD